MKGLIKIFYKRTNMANESISFYIMNITFNNNNNNNKNNNNNNNNDNNDNNNNNNK